MISTWWLVLIIPAAIIVGYSLCACAVANTLAELRDRVAMKLKEMESDEQSAKARQDHEG